MRNLGEDQRTERAVSRETGFYFLLFTEIGTLYESKVWSTVKLSLGLLNLRNL